MELQADQLEAPEPGTRRVALSKKPAAELAHSKQKLVQGMVKFSLETPRTAARPENVSDAAAVPLGTMTGNRAGPSAVGIGRASKGASPYVGDVSTTARNTEGQPTTEQDTTAGAAAASKKWGRNNEEVKITQTEPTEGRTRKQCDESAARAAADNGNEWEGVTWDEPDVDGAESLGTVSARLTCADSASLESITLGTVELASEDGGSQPQDVLICLKGIAGMRQVTPNSNPKRHALSIMEVLRIGVLHRK